MYVLGYAVPYLDAGTLTVAGQRYDRLHPFSMEDYFNGHHPHLPAMLDPYTGKPDYQMALL